MAELNSPNNRSALSNPDSTSSQDPMPTRRSLRNAAARDAGRAQSTIVRQGTAVATAPRTPAPPSPLTKKRHGQKRAFALLTILVIPGFIATTSIPAFALGFGGQQTTYAKSSLASDAQSLEVTDSVKEISVKRGSFDATTQKQLDAKKAAAAIIKARAGIATAGYGANGGQYSNVGPRAAGDDYPWPTSSGLSPLRYVARQCTDFVAWRLNRDAGHTSAPWKYDWSNMTPGGGNASAWAGAWARNGWKTSHTPVNGAVAWFNGNHVAYVKSIDGNNVNLEEYNWNSSGAYHTRTIPTSSVALYLYPPP